MARQPKIQQSTAEQKAKEDVQSISSAPVEEMPEGNNTMTGAAAKAAPKEPTLKGPAKAIVEAQAKAGTAAEPEAPKVEYARVLQDRAFRGATGYRARLHAGKEISSAQYNFKQLRAQGVRLEKIEADELANF